jgi:major type 1 subunit fimbrin (pilin)
VQIKKVYVQFYITGAVTPGNVAFNSPTLAALIGPNYLSETDAVTFSNLTITGSVPVTVLACETPDITVNLKKHNSTEFPSVGSTSPTTDFNFTIKNCPKKLNSIHYTFKPASGITLKGSGTGQYLTLDSDSSASGVGVQMLYENGTHVPFNTKTKYTGYNTSTGGSYTIPMKARYIRTGAISPGTANSAVEFTMSYE